MDKAEQPTIAQADEILREIFLYGHSEGWTGNQTRRDVQQVDAENGWSLYVSNGALEKTKARHRTTSLAAQDGLICTGCGSTKSIEQIRAEHPSALSCCPERKMVSQSKAAQDGLVEALDDATIDQIILNFAGGVVQVPSEHNPRGYVSYYRPREAMRKALSAIKEQHHD